MKLLKSLLIASLLCPVSALATQSGDDFDSFMRDNMKDFNSFITKANREYIDFMRNPWKKYEGSDPVEKRAKPEPIKVPVFDPNIHPVDEVPHELTIKTVLDQTTQEAKQGKTIIADIIQETISSPNTSQEDQLANKKCKPTTTVIRDTVKAEPQPAPVAPVTTPEPTKPTTEAPKAPQTPKADTKPAPAPVAPETTPEPTKPTTEAPKAPQTPKADTKPTPAPVAPVTIPTPTKPTTEAPKAPQTPKADTKPTPAPVAPVTTPEPTKPTTEAPKAPQTPKADTKPAAKPVNKTQNSPIYSGGADRMPIKFGGIQYYISNNLKNVITLRSVDENAIADCFESLYMSDYKPLLSDLTELRKNDLGNDWALYLFIKQASEEMVGKKESIVLRQFLLNNLGYRARTARNAKTNELRLMVAPSVQLYGCIFLDVADVKFYDVESDNPYAFYMCPQEAPSAKKTINMSQAVMPHLKGDRKPSVHTVKKSSLSVSTSVSTQMADYYNRIPQCDYSVYATAQVDNEVAAPVLASLKAAIKGKTESEAANILLDFCQNAFDYATDRQQFGYEKPFFVEELFYYPYCDCEDRSILYRYLVKSLLGLDVVLLDYPNHIATAVKFNSDVKGDFITIDGNKYLVCDPTYIGASIGRAMPQFKNAAANVLRY